MENPIQASTNQNNMVLQWSNPHAESRSAGHNPLPHANLGASPQQLRLAQLDFASRTKRTGTRPAGGCTELRQPGS